MSSKGMHMIEGQTRPSSLRCVVGGVLTVVTASAPGGVVVFDNIEDWASPVGSFTTIDFTGFPDGTPITDQYADLGVLFTFGADFVVCCSELLYPPDGAGLDGNAGTEVVFDTPQSWLAVDFPGLITVELYRGEELLFSGEFGGGDALFIGFVSTEVFDRAFFRDGSNVNLGNLYFGPGNGCPWDLDATAQVTINDFLLLLFQWGTDPAGPPDFDGDGDVGIVDFLELLANWGPCSHFFDCNGNGIFDLIDLNDATSPDCNSNAAPDECDVAEGASPDFNVNGIPDECEPPPNDVCEDAMVILDGTTPVVTFGAATEEPLVICEGGTKFFKNDIWFVYTAPCTGMATFTLCNDADFDTRLAVYFGGTCPTPLNPLACSDDAAGCGQTSEIQLLVPEGFSYLVRVGGPEGGGYGMLTVSCGP